MHRRLAILVSLFIVGCMAIGCSKPPASDETSDNNAAPKTSSWFGKKEVTVPHQTTTQRLRHRAGSAKKK